MDKQIFDDLRTSAGQFKEESKIILRRSSDGSAARWPTSVGVKATSEALFVRFECVDDHAWGTWTERDEPLWQEEVVEVFLAPSSVEDLASPPKEYIELEVSPLGVLFDARVSNPDGERATMRVDTAWDWPGVEWRAGRVQPARRQDWWAELKLPWRGLGLHGAPELLRANFYRVERPAGQAGPDDEFTAWSPTWADPPDFHRPEFFGLLVTRSALQRPHVRRGVEVFEESGGVRWVLGDI